MGWRLDAYQFALLRVHKRSRSCGHSGLVIPQRLGHASVAFFGAVAVLIGLALLSMAALAAIEVLLLWKVSSWMQSPARQGASCQDINSYGPWPNYAGDLD